jgi:hypothetical protein
MTKNENIKTHLTSSRGRRKSKSCAGSSIVETLMSLVVFALFVGGGAQMMVAHRQMSDMARAHYVAANIAKNRVELIRSYGFSELTNFSEDEILVDTSGYPSSSGNFRRSTEILSTGRDNLSEVVVMVEIRDRKTLGFKGRNETIRTYVAEYLTEESSVGSGVTAD